MLFITKFHLLLRNKWLWSGFAFMVVVSFVAWGTRTGGDSSGAHGTAGKLDGKDVSLEESLAAVARLTQAAAAVRAALPEDLRGAPIARAVDEVAARAGGRWTDGFVVGHAALRDAEAALAAHTAAVTRAGDAP